MSRWWRALALGAAVGLSATACGGDDAPPPAAALSMTPTPGATTSGVAAEFQGLVDRLVVDRALARTDRATAAAEFNREGSDRPAAMEKVKAACAALLGVYQGFESAVRGLAVDEAAKGDLDALLGATEALREEIAKYADATSPEEFATINSAEMVATAVWEQTVNGLAASLGTPGLGAAPTPSATAVPTGSPSEAPSGEPSPEPSASGTPAS